MGQQRIWNFRINVAPVCYQEYAIGPHAIGILPLDRAVTDDRIIGLEYSVLALAFDRSPIFDPVAVNPATVISLLNLVGRQTSDRLPVVVAGLSNLQQLDLLSCWLRESQQDGSSLGAPDTATMHLSRRIGSISGVFGSRPSSCVMSSPYGSPWRGIAIRGAG